MRLKCIGGFFLVMDFVVGILFFYGCWVVLTGSNRHCSLQLISYRIDIPDQVKDFPKTRHKEFLVETGLQY